jgi:hypothetical protein
MFGFGLIDWFNIVNTLDGVLDEGSSHCLVMNSKSLLSSLLKSDGCVQIKFSIEGFLVLHNVELSFLFYEYSKNIMLSQENYKYG